MKYIKGYINNKSNQYHLVKEFNESEELYSYAIGYYENAFLIHKLDYSGALVWTKTYNDKDQEGIEGFHDIIQVRIDPKTVIYVLQYTTRDYHCGLVAIDTFGEVVWSQEISRRMNRSFLTEIPGADAFFVTLDRADESLVVLQFLHDGSIIKEKEIQDSRSITLEQTHYFSKDLFFCGAINTSGIQSPCVLQFDFDLDTTYVKVLSDIQGSAHSLHLDFKGNYLVSGYDDRNDCLFVTYFNAKDISTSIQCIENSERLHSKILVTLTNDFFLHAFSDHGVLFKFASLFQIEWLKSLEYQSGEKNRFTSITYKNNHFSFISHWSKEQDLIGKSLTDFQTCKTVAYEVPRLNEQNTKIAHLEYRHHDERISLAPTRFEFVSLRLEERIVCEVEENTSTQPIFNEFTQLQSSSFVLSAAGSDGFDGSAKGIHLRWDFSGTLGDLHLPKGDYTQNTDYFNKPNDFVQLFRAKYTPHLTVFDFSLPPQAVDHSQRFWIYTVQNKLVYLRFHDSIQYDSLLGSHNPLQNPVGFLTAYGNRLVEFEARRDFFFGFRFATSGMTSSSYVELEALSAQEQGLIVPKYVHTRKRMGDTDEETPFYVTNGKSIRFKATQCVIIKLLVEFYSDFIVETNASKAWEYLGDFALSLDDSIVEKRLEPETNLIHGQWLHYTDSECLNIDNYKDRWNGTTQGEDRTIKQIVERYLTLSTNGTDNPTAIDYLNFINEDDEDDTYLQPHEDDEIDEGMPLLDFIRGGSIDYHLARMLGLGTLDISDDVIDTESSFIYLAQYVTLKDIHNPDAFDYKIQLSMSLPTNYRDQRLPIPYELETIIPGIASLNETQEIYPYTDEEGYTHDGVYRYVSLKAAPVYEEAENSSFYSTDFEFDLSTFSYTSFVGLEYKQNQETEWRKPELSSNSQYKTLYQNQPGSYEPIPIFIDEDHHIVYIHKQRESGIHHYALYGVNLFSRTTPGSTILTTETALIPKNTLQPPHQVSAHLIVKEQPLMFTTSEEQNRLENITDNDSTLVRLTFEYNSIQELKSYQVEEIFATVSDTDLTNEFLGGLPNPYYPDDKEIYADVAELYFRPETPQAIRGKVISLAPHPTESFLYVIETGIYTFPSSSSSLNGIEPLVPELNPIHQSNFIGSVLNMGSQSFLVQSIHFTGNFPIFHVIPQTLLQGEDEVLDFQEPIIENEGLFIVTENLQETTTWNQPIHVTGGLNPHSFEVQIGIHQSPLWKIHREVVYSFDEDGEPIRFLEKSRGFWSEATIEQQEEVIDVITHSDGSQQNVMGFRGLYKVTFNQFTLPQHPQFDALGLSVEWFRGSIRLRTAAQMLSMGSRKTFGVHAIAEDSSGNLVLYFEDPQFPNDPQDQVQYDAISEGVQLVHFYPGYKVYLYAQPSLMLTSQRTLPETLDAIQYTIFGLRSKQLAFDYRSKFSIPALMYGQKQQEPAQPLPPEGVLYATRPDSEGKSTYSFEVSFGSSPQSGYSPYGLLFLRSNEDAFLHALYDYDTVQDIRDQLKEYGGLDELFVTNRWQNFLDFSALRITGQYASYPDDGELGYAFPMPNHPQFIASINSFIEWHNQQNGTHQDAGLIQTITSLHQEVIGLIHGVQEPLLIIDFVEQTLENTFVPLTELPIIYQHIKQDHVPRAGKQIIKDAQGFLLAPEDDNFEMAPMAKRKSLTTNTVQFTDFTLDGTSKNLYFYGVKEMSLQMQMGKMSAPLGPIKLVNTYPIYAPEVQEIYPVLENRILGISPNIHISINAYDIVHQIKKIKLYRTFESQKATSVLSMEPVKVFDVDIMGWEGQDTWSLFDDFSDVIDIPYNTPAFYRIVAERKIEYSDSFGDSIIDYAPSHASKLIAVVLPEAYSPETPHLKIYSEAPSDGMLNHVKLVWNKTCYQGIYHIYKMTVHGNWNKIHEVAGNQNVFIVALEDTQWEDHSLVIEDQDRPVYHHFKIVAENSSGMMSTDERIITMFQSIHWHPLDELN